MTAASQIVTPVSQLDQVDTALAILAGTNVAATLTISSSAGGPLTFSVPVTAARLADWQAALTTLQTSLKSQLSALGIILT